MNDGNDRPSGPPESANGPSEPDSTPQKLKPVQSDRLAEGYTKGLVVGAKENPGSPVKEYAVLDGNGGLVATMIDGYPFEVDGEDRLVMHHSQANAHLFAAAPELYEVCKKTYASLLASGAQGTVLGELRRALEKANPGFTPDDLPKAEAKTVPEVDPKDLN